jgi:hypothetical protein
MYTRTMSADHTCMVNMCQFATDDRSSKKRWIPADLVQNTAEYLERVAGFLSFRGVSITWQGAVSDAVGFLNGRCWTRLSIRSPLLVTLRVDDGAAADRCALLCLGPRLETLDGRFPFPSGLLGEENNALTTLTLRHGTTDMHGLKNCRALKKLYFASNTVIDAGVTDADVRGLALILTLEDLNLEACTHVTDVSCLRESHALKKLNLRCTGATDAGIRGLERIPTLEDLNLMSTRVTDVSRLRDSRALKILNLRCSGVTDAGIRGLELIPTLEHLNLWNSNVTDTGIRGLELIPTLVDLALAGCKQLKDVSCLRDSRTLRKLNLWSAGVTDAGIRGLELITTLVDLDFADCQQLKDVSCLRNCDALKTLYLSWTGVTDAGIRGLELIPHWRISPLNVASN